MERCCEKECHKKLSVDMIKRSRTRFWYQNSDQRTQWLFDHISEASVKGTRLYMQCESGIELCSKSFRLMYKIDENKFYKTLKKYRSGSIAPGVKKSRDRSEGYFRSMDWLEDYAYYHADRMPHNEEMMLPYKTRKLSVFQKYRTETLDNHKRAISKTSFFNMWAGNFPHLKIKKVGYILFSINDKTNSPVILDFSSEKKNIQS